MGRRSPHFVETISRAVDRLDCGGQLSARRATAGHHSSLDCTVWLFPMGVSSPSAPNRVCMCPLSSHVLRKSATSRGGFAATYWYSHFSREPRNIALANRVLVSLPAPLAEFRMDSRASDPALNRVDQI